MDANRVAEIRKLHKKAQSLVDTWFPESVTEVLTAIPEMLDEIVLLQGQVGQPASRFDPAVDRYSAEQRREWAKERNTSNIHYGTE